MKEDLRRSDPEEFDLSADGKHLFVSNEDVKTASSVDIANGKVEKIVSLSQEPEGVGGYPDGKRLFVTCETGGEVFVIDIATFKVVGPREDRRAAAQRGLPAERQDRHRAVGVGRRAVCHRHRYDQGGEDIPLPKGSRPMRVRVSPDGSKLYASTGRGGSVAVLDAKNYAVLNTIAVGQRPWGIVVSPDGKYLFSANGPSNDVSVVDLATSKEIAKVKAGSSPGPGDRPYCPMT